MKKPPETKKEFFLNQIPAVVTPLDEHMGLDIARSLGKRGIPVFGFDPDPKVAGRTSKYCHLVVCPDPKQSAQEYVQFLVDWGKTQITKTVLYPLSDEIVLLCSRERQKLQPYFEFVMPDHAVLDRMASKQGLASAAAAFDIPAPQTITPADVQEVESIARRLSYPVILKPVEAAFWHTPEITALLRKNALSGRVKVVECRTPTELLQAYRSIAAYDDRLIIQEVIQGPDENLVYISFYLNRQSVPLAIFAGRKMRTLPVGFGSASYVRSFHDPDLDQIALKLLTQAQYQGLGGLEFKKDERDGRYKLVEFNTRFGMWDGLAVHCGVDTPYIAYQDTLGRPVVPQLTYRPNIIWVDLQKDVRSFWISYRQGRLTLGQWIRSLQGEKMWAIYSWDDWRPGIVFSFDLIWLLLKRLVGKTKVLSIK